MNHPKWPKRDPIKNYFPVPNEVFLLGLSPGELAVYSYLLFCEDRSTYQCWPSFKTIGKATGMSTNTVRKYVRMLEDRGLIATEPTSIITKGGQKRNGNLLFTICPIQEAAVGENIPGCAEGESVGYESQAGTSCVTGCMGLCEAFPVGVRKQYPNSYQRRFGPILRQFEEITFYRSAENKKDFLSALITFYRTLLEHSMGGLPCAKTAPHKQRKEFWEWAQKKEEIPKTSRQQSRVAPAVVLMWACVFFCGEGKEIILHAPIPAPV